jgi:hypothetical protein
LCANQVYEQLGLVANPDAAINADPDLPPVPGLVVTMEVKILKLLLSLYANFNLISFITYSTRMLKFCNILRHPY